MKNEEIVKVLAEIDAEIADAMNAILNKSTELAMFHIGSVMPPEASYRKSKPKNNKPKPKRHK